MDSFVHSLYVIILFQNLVQTLYTSLDISYHVDERCVIIILVVRNLLDVKEFTCAMYICRFDSEHNRRVRCELYRESRSQEEEFGKQMIESKLFLA